MPLLANIPSAVFNSSVPPLIDFAVAPIVKMPSPSYETDVLVVDAVFDI